MSVPPVGLECVEAIYRLDREGQVPSLAALARRLGLGGGAVKKAVLGLQAQGLVEVRGFGRLVLTDGGERLAVRQIRRHRLLERFLTDLIGLGWEEVHEEAGRLTPVISDRVGSGLAKLLGDPTACPHGNAIPSADGDVEVEVGIPLHRLHPGQAGIIVRIEREELELLKYLATLGLMPETRVEVDEVAPFRGPLLVRIGSSRYALGRKVASHIIVKEV